MSKMIIFGLAKMFFVSCQQELFYLLRVLNCMKIGSCFWGSSSGSTGTLMMLMPPEFLGFELGIFFHISRMASVVLTNLSIFSRATFGLAICLALILSCWYCFARLRAFQTISWQCFYTSRRALLLAEVDSGSSIVQGVVLGGIGCLWTCPLMS